MEIDCRVFIAALLTEVIKLHNKMIPTLFYSETIRDTSSPEPQSTAVRGLPTQGGNGWIFVTFNIAQLEAGNFLRRENKYIVH